MYGGTAAHPPAEFVLANMINQQAEAIKALEDRVAKLEEGLLKPQRVVVADG